MRTHHAIVPSGRRLSAALALMIAVAGMMCLGAASAEAKLTISRFSAGFEQPAGTPATQAGAHSDLVIDFGFAEHPDPYGSGISVPTENAKDLEFDLPAGFYGNPQAVPTCDLGELVARGGFCNTDSQVGVVNVQVGPDPTLDFIFGTYRAPVYNVTPHEGKTAAFIFSVLGVAVRIDVSARTDGDYGLQSTIKNATNLLPLYGTTLRLWGVPADPVHDVDRRTNYFDTVGRPSGISRRPFLTMPARCEPVTFGMRVTSWQDPSTTVSASDATPPLTGCDALRFAPTITTRPEVRKPDTPSALDVDLAIPQNDSWSGLGTPPLKKAVVTLPEGVAISPASAQGLEACSDEQIALHSKAEPTCPDASKIGTVSIDTPLLADPLEGEIILGTPTAEHLFRLFLVARGSGLLLKLPGVAQPDPKTGQLTTTFDDNPQLPFTNLHLHFKGGGRAPLATPQSCGTKTTTATLEPWAGQTVTATDSFDITGCTGGFAPTYDAGTTNPEAGAFSPFTMTIRRNDGDQELSGISASLPPGLLGILAGIPQCPEAQVVAGTCDGSSQIGTTTVEAGSGDQPLPLTGKVFLAGAYKGQPYSVAFVVRAVAGPFDLGTVIIRAPLNIDASSGKVSVTADALPTILQGVPLRLRTINVTLDRPGFMFNPTNCTPMSVGATITSVGGAVATPTSRFQVLGCGELPLKPAFKLMLSGHSQLKKGGHPGVVADLSQKPGQAGLKRVEVTLPSGVSVALPNLSIFCHKADADARKCPATSIVGSASAKTPALPAPLTGPVYLVEGSKKDPKTGKDVPTLPRLWLKLQGGGIPLDLWGDTNVVGGRVITTFATIPDAPISNFELKINGGAKGILQTSKAMCSTTRATRVTFAGQNGAIVKRTIRATAACPKRTTKKKTT